MGQGLRGTCLLTHLMEIFPVVNKTVTVFVPPFEFCKTTLPPLEEESLLNSAVLFAKVVFRVMPEGKP